VTSGQAGLLNPEKELVMANIRAVLWNNFDRRQAFIARAQTREALVAAIANEICRHNMSDVCTADFESNEEEGIEHADVELTYIECYKDFEVSLDGGANCDRFDDYRTAAKEFAKLVVNRGHYS
jgi:hypothetical protein